MAYKWMGVIPSPLGAHPLTKLIFPRIRGRVGIHRIEGLRVMVIGLQKVGGLYTHKDSRILKVG